VLFITLCIVCAYPSTPVLSGLWRTCGLILGVLISLQISVLQQGTIGVDKNLFGVSAQVTAPGVLVFGQIFRTLRAGNQGRVEHRSEEFARTATHFGSAIHLKAASTPATADHGRHRGVKKCCGLALRDDVE